MISLTCIAVLLWPRRAPARGEGGQHGRDCQGP